MSGAEEEIAAIRHGERVSAKELVPSTYLQYILFSGGLAQVLLVAALFIAAQQPAGNVWLTASFGPAEGRV